MVKKSPKAFNKNGHKFLLCKDNISNLYKCSKCMSLVYYTDNKFRWFKIGEEDLSCGDVILKSVL